MRHSPFIRSLFVVALSLTGLSLCRAEKVSCSTNYSVPGQYINGSCSHGSCHGYIFSETRSASGYCGNSNFQAQATIYGDSISGDCRSGRFQTYLGSNSLRWTGSCSGGGRYSGNSTEYSGSLTGNCTENGSFSAYTSSEYLTIYGQCDFPSESSAEELAQEESGPT